MRRHASRAELALLLLLSGDVHPNPGPTVRVGQLNCAGLTKEKRLSLLRYAADVDVLLLQELKMSEREALGFTLPGFQGITKARNPKGTADSLGRRVGAMFPAPRAAGPGQ